MKGLGNPFLIVGDEHRDLDGSARGPVLTALAAREANRTGRKVTVCNAKGRKILIVLPDPLFDMM